MTTYTCPFCTATFTRQKSYEESAAVPRFIGIRCANCGTPVWSHYRLGRKAAAVRVGSLDDPSAVHPDAAIYVTDKPSWAPLPEGVPSFGEYYNPAELLAPDRFARLKALIEQ